MTKLSDQWRTPDWLFDELNKEFNFDIDLCATKENSKCRLWYKDYLEDNLMNSSFSDEVGMIGMPISSIINDWKKEIKCAFMNPPYSNPKPFIKKAWEDSKYCKIVCLVKCDPSTRWWATFWNYTSSKCDMYHLKYEQCPLEIGPKPGCEVRFFPKRIQFDPPQELIDSGDVWKVGNKWVQKCPEVVCIVNCQKCKGKGYKSLSGPTFPCALVIMDRRGV